MVADQGFLEEIKVDSEPDRSRIAGDDNPAVTGGDELLSLIEHVANIDQRFPAADVTHELRQGDGLTDREVHPFGQHIGSVREQVDGGERVIGIPAYDSGQVSMCAWESGAKLTCEDVVIGSLHIIQQILSKRVPG